MGRGRNWATPSSPSPANTGPEERTTTAAAHSSILDIIIEKRRMLETSKRHVSADSARYCRAWPFVLLADHVRRRALVLGADELDQLFVRNDLLVHANGEGRRVRLGIVDRDVDAQRSVIRPGVSLGHLRLVRERTSVDVEPPAVAEVVGVDDERVAFPVTGGVAVPPGLDVAVFRKRTAVGEDLPDAGIALITNDDQIRRLDDLSRLRMDVELHQSHRQAVRVRVVLGV